MYYTNLVDLEKSNLSNLSVYRYMELRWLEDILTNRKIYFPSATQFSDKSEGAITYINNTDIPEELEKIVSHIENSFIRLKEFSKISCWHINDYDNDLFWNRYIPKGGIAIQTTVGKLLESLTPYKVSDNSQAERIYFGRVSYNKDNIGKNYYKNSDIDRFFRKHPHYSSDNEFRVLVSLCMASEWTTVEKEGIYLDINIQDFIKSIYVSTGTEDSVIKFLENMTQRLSMNFPIKKSIIDSIRPLYSP